MTEANKVGTHVRTMRVQGGYPSVQAFYGTYDKLLTAHRTLCLVYGDFDNPATINADTPCTSIPRGFTVAVEDNVNHSVVEYQYKKEMPVGGYTMADLDLKNEVPSVSIINDLTHTDTNKALSANQGKVLKEYVDAVNNGIDSLNKAIATLGTNNDPIVIPPTAVVLPTSGTLEYDADDTYVISINGTQIATVHYPYEHTESETTSSYLVFKAIDRDLYYVYIHTTANYYTPFEQEQYSDLSHSEAQAIFKAGQYAIKQIIDVNGRRSAAGTPSPKGYWEHGIPSVFVTMDGYPLRYNQIKEGNDYFVLLKCDEVNKIFKYSADNESKWSLVSGGCYTKGDTTTGANYTLYDKYFDTGEACNIGFDDSITQFGNGVDTIQKAINYLTTAVVSNNCLLNVTLNDFDGSRIVGEYIGLSYVLSGGAPVVLSDLEDATPALSTDSNGVVHAVIPYGAVYTIKFNTRTNRQVISDWEDTAATNHINIIRTYAKQADKEQVLIQVAVRNANSNNYDLTGKEVYIDFLNSSDQVVTSAAITCYLTRKGEVGTWKDISEVTHTYSTDPIFIDRGQHYRVRLQEWNTSIPDPDDQEFIKSGDITIAGAQDYARSFYMYYTYKFAGIFFVVEDYEDTTDLETYKEYRCDSYDDTNHTVTIIDPTDNTTKYIIKYDSTLGGICRAPYNDPTNFALWISASADNIKKAIGVGIRTSDTINNNLEYPDYSTKYTDCSFLISRKMTTSIKKPMQDSTTQWEALPYTKYSGKCVTHLMADSASPYSPMADHLETEATLAYTFGGLTQRPFIPSYEQAQIIANNKTFIKNVLMAMGNNYFTSTTLAEYTTTTREVGGSGYYTFVYVNIYGNSGTPHSKMDDQIVIPLYCF